MLLSQWTINGMDVHRCHHRLRWSTPNAVSWAPSLTDLTADAPEAWQTQQFHTQEAEKNVQTDAWKKENHRRPHILCQS